MGALKACAESGRLELLGLQSNPQRMSGVPVPPLGALSEARMTALYIPYRYVRIQEMSTIGSVDAPIEIFGGLVTDMSPADLPHGVSPDCQDVAFGSGDVATRPGLQALFGPLAGNPTVNYLKTYITPNETLRTMALDGKSFVWNILRVSSLRSKISRGFLRKPLIPRDPQGRVGYTHCPDER